MLFFSGTKIDNTALGDTLLCQLLKGELSVTTEITP